MHSESGRPVTAADVAWLAAACGAEDPSSEAAGPRAGGMRDGRLWIVHPDGSVGECRCVRGAGLPCGVEAAEPRFDGLPDGRWRFVHPDGSVEEGRSVRGLLDGDWALRDPSGAVVACRTWRHGRAVPGTAGCVPAEGCGMIPERPVRDAVWGACRRVPAWNAKDGSLAPARGWPPASLPTSGKGEAEPGQQFRTRQRASRGFPPSSAAGFTVKCRQAVGQVRRILQTGAELKWRW